MAVRIIHLAEILISDHAELEHDASFPSTVEIEATGAVGLSLILHRPSWLRIHLAEYVCSDKNLACLSVHNLSFECVGMAKCRLHKAEHHHKEEFLK